MAYATSTDLALEFKGLTYGASLLAVTVDEWCVQASNLIDSYVGKVYSTPVVSATSPLAFSVLKMLCIQLVRPRMESVLQVRTGETRTSQTRGDSPSPSSSAAAMKSLCAIRDEDMDLVDATLVTQANGVRSTLTDCVSTTIPEFTREDPAW